MDEKTQKAGTPDAPERKRGRPPGTLRPSSMVKVTMLLDPDDTEWAKSQPEGVSGMVRRMLREAREKSDKGSKNRE